MIGTIMYEKFEEHYDDETKKTTFHCQFCDFKLEEIYSWNITANMLKNHLNTHDLKWDQIQPWEDKIYLHEELRKIIRKISGRR